MAAQRIQSGRIAWECVDHQMRELRNFEDYTDGQGAQHEYACIVGVSAVATPAP